MVTKLRIALCDTNRQHVAQVHKILSHILFQECEFLIDAFFSATDVLNCISSGRFSYDIIFLEMDLGSFSGLDVASRLRYEKVPTEIIFLTRNDRLIREGYKYRAFDYLLKPVSVTHISEVMHRFLKNFYLKDSIFSFKNGRETFNVRLEHINHFSSCGRVITIVGRYEDYNYYGKLDDLENILPPHLFLRPHQSYFVNLEYIKTFTKEALTMYGGFTIPISRKRLSHTEHVLRQFLGQEMLAMSQAR